MLEFSVKSLASESSSQGSGLLVATLQHQERPELRRTFCKKLAVQRRNLERRMFSRTTHNKIRS